MAQAELNHVSTLVIIAICIVHCSKSIDGQAGAASSSGSAPARLEVDAATPMPSPGAQIGLRAAYALARRNGLTRADHVSLSLSTKDPKAPLVLWTFQGKHTQQDSQAIHIDALTGALVDEDRMNDLTRAERDTQLQKGLEALQSLFRPRSADDSKVETFYTLLSKRPASENVLFVLATEPPRRLLSTSFPSFQLC